MKLFYSPTSPFVRKVMACAIAVGIDNQIERVTTNPWESPPDLLAANPLSKVPCLVTDDGVALYDSPLICEYVDFAGRGTLFPPAGPARWLALRQQSAADGLMDAAILRRMDAARPAEPARTAVMDRQRDNVARALDALERETLADHLDIGTITVGCALAYLDFRFEAEPWRPAHPKLAAWFEKFATRPELTKTAP